MSISDAADMSATAIRWDPERENWEVTGTGTDGESITLIFAISGNKVHTVTAFGERNRD